MSSTIPHHRNSGSIESEALSLVADIGATNARFALAVSGSNELIQPLTLLTRNFTSIFLACREYLNHIADLHPSRACIAVACPISGDHVSLTNNSWSFSIEEFRQELNVGRLMVVNDFKALAAGVPRLAAEEIIQLGDGTPIPERPISVIGPGTGLGVATVIQYETGQIFLDGEGGHVSFAPGNERELEILRLLSRQFNHVSTERILSGDGIKTLFQTLAKIDGVVAPDLTASSIVERAISGSDSHCLEVIDIFCGVLGSFAGDLAMTLNSQGGVYIGGGIIPRIAKLLKDSSFRTRFEGKGRISSFIKNVPTYLIMTDRTALTGAASLLFDDLKG
jgi:glucokinase